MSVMEARYNRKVDCCFLRLVLLTSCSSFCPTQGLAHLTNHHKIRPGITVNRTTKSNTMIDIIISHITVLTSDLLSECLFMTSLNEPPLEDI